MIQFSHRFSLFVPCLTYFLVTFPHHRNQRLVSVPFFSTIFFPCSPRPLEDHQKVFCLLWKCTELSRCFKTTHCNNLKLIRVNIANWLFTKPRKVNEPVDSVIWTRQGSLAYLALSPLERLPCYIYCQRHVQALVSDSKRTREVSVGEHRLSNALMIHEVNYQPQDVYHITCTCLDTQWKTVCHSPVRVVYTTKICTMATCTKYMLLKMFITQK